MENRENTKVFGKESAVHQVVNSESSFSFKPESAGRIQGERRM